MKLPRVAFIIPAFNCETFLAECLQSALDQGYANIRVYVVDDASTDGTFSIASEYAQRYPQQVFVARNKKNLGKGATRQRASEMAFAGECAYLAPLDADDVRKPNSLLPQVELLERNPNAAVCYAKTDIIKYKGELRKTPWRERLSDWLKGLPEGQVWPYLITRGKLGTTDTIVIRSSAARACRHNPDLPYFQDIDFLAQLATLPAGSDFIALDRVVASYRYHSGQSANIKDPSSLHRIKSRAMKTIAKGVFARLAQQGRPLPKWRIRWLLRVLLARLTVQAGLARDWSECRSLVMDFLMPVSRVAGGGEHVLSRVDYVTQCPTARHEDP